MTGDLPSVQFFFRIRIEYRTFAAIERDSKGYVAVVTKRITKPQDLAGKTIATRVGSTGSWFISEFLTKNGIDPKSVTIKNLDTQILPAALCRGDIDAFFIWQPIPSRTLEICPNDAHYLSDATGYIQGYLVAGARPQFLNSPDGAEKVTRFLRAVMKGRDKAAERFRGGRRIRQSEPQPERGRDARPVGNQHPAGGAGQNLLRRFLQPEPLGAQGAKATETGNSTSRC